MTKQIEILSPAGNFESLKSAVNNGADAVYLGLSDFNARGNIENFTLDNIGMVISYAHLFGVKVYVTLNTLIKDEEMSIALNMVKNALEAGVDAFIVQDIGLCYYLRQNFPNIELHASTQMGLQNLEGLQALSDIAFKRVVLARETPLEEVARIKENLDIEIEYFVQGALCVAFSGNCYLCSLLAGSSGNRGKCKQFCRLPFSLNNDKAKKEGYLLSTKDFCLLPSLKTLAEKGVDSLKIEGRARRPAYVGVATSVYKGAVDNDFNYTKQDVENLKKVYNRGDYINGYFGNEKLIYPFAQNHIGIEIGRVIKTNYGKNFNIITIKTDYNLKKGDTLKFFDDKKECGVITAVDIKQIKKDEYDITTTSKIKPGCTARLIVDTELEETTLAKRRFIEVDAVVFAKEGERARLILSTNKAQIEVESDFTLEKAKTHPLTEEECQIQLAKMGEYFKLKCFKATLDDVFMTKAQLNELRRQGLEKLQEKILENYSLTHNLQRKAIFNPCEVKLTQKETLTQTMIYTDDLSKVDTQITTPIILAPENFDNIDLLYQKFKNLNVYLSLPVMATAQEIEKIKDILNSCQNWGIYANNYYALNLVSPSKTIIGANLNVYNSCAVKYYIGKGYKNIVLTQEEVDLNNIKNNGANLFAFAEYYPEYMYFRHCPYKEHLSSTCQNCKYDGKLKYYLNNKEFNVKRRRILSCQFVLKSTALTQKKLPNDINKIIEF